MSDLGALAIDYAPWIMLASLLLFFAKLLGNIRQAEIDERRRQSAVAEGRIVGFLEQDGRETTEPTLYPNGNDDHGMLVVYEFQPDAQSATIRGQDTVAQNDLALVRVGTKVRVRFNPRLPTNSRLDARELQAFSASAVPSAIPVQAARASERLNWMLLAFVALWFGAEFFPSRRFVPSSATVSFSYLIAAACAVWIFVVGRRVPARLPETPASRFVTLWVRPLGYALLTMLSLPQFFGHLLPAAITSAAGTNAERQLALSGHESDFARGGKTSRLQWRCAKAEFKGIPSRLVGDDVLCTDSDALPAAGTVVRLSGQVTPFGILVGEVSW